MTEVIRDKGSLIVLDERYLHMPFYPDVRTSNLDMLAAFRPEEAANDHLLTLGALGLYNEKQPPAESEAEATQNQGIGLTNINH